MFTVISEILMSIKITSWLEVVAVVVVVALLSSPGLAGTALGVGTKIGIIKHITGRKEP